MPEANTITFQLENKSPSELEGRRRDIIAEMQTKYKGYDDPDVPMALLAELAVITSTLRRKNAGPPKATKPPKGAKVTSASDLMI
jgi:hypothetical protein